MRLLPIVVLLLSSLMACQSPQDPAQSLIDQAIAAHGGDAINNTRISFDFRKAHLVLEQQGGRFRYERTQPDSTGQLVRDVLTNDGFTRHIDGKPQVLDTAQVGKYSRSVNSIAYFVLLPWKLHDPAVVPTLLGSEQIDGQTYDKVQVKFRADGGGKDHGDTFVYWFNQRTYTLDCLAYSEGGPRFRRAIHPQTVAGIRFQDYINYKSDADTLDVATYARRYQARQMVELSRIEQKNIQVTPLPKP
ncbi:DUF6503 family protein [Spirosoma rhododendri]|uniref:Deoxyribose-phosphate aldolase n=1 Tax=Spirosoma rhododendri TaxID=2728024 RepID=A0A7L5DGM7_9BACT|nr:DUF6503 family protein [Spirosoma rhododendri]QJD77406.1 hypothetical protein HH216_02460 [Spirosoma rhododendri]